MAKINFSAPLVVNGHSRQLVVDLDAKEYHMGYFLFWGGGIKVQSGKVLNELADEFKRCGFKEVK